MALIETANAGSLHEVEDLIARGADLEQRDAEGNTPLMTAAGQGHVDAVTLLLSSGANVSAHCDAGNTALHAAALYGHAPVVSILLRHGADPNARNNRGMTPLRIAVARGSIETITTLIDGRANPNLADENGQTALMGAAAIDSVEAVKALVQAGAIVDAIDKAGLNALCYAMNKGALRTVDALFALGAKIGSAGPMACTMALSAPQHSDEITLRLIEKEGVPPNSKEGLTSLYLAIALRRTTIVNALLAAGANPNEGVKTEDGLATPLMAAIATNDKTLISVLVEAGADVTRKISGVAPLTAARVGGRDEAVEVLCAADVVKRAIFLGHQPAGIVEISSDLGRELETLWQVMIDRPRSPIDEVAEIFGSARLKRMMPDAEALENPPIYNEFDTALEMKRKQLAARLVESIANVEALVNKTSAAFQSMLMVVLNFVANHAEDVPRIVYANFAGIRKNLREENVAKQRCLSDLAAAVAKDADWYEDGEEATAAAEFILSRIPLSSLMDAATGTPKAESIRNDGLEYEELCSQILNEQGFSVRKTPGSGDQGADLIATKSGLSYAIQCKHYEGSVGNAAVQEAISARSYYSTDYAVVVTSGQFTMSARELAARAKIALVKEPNLKHISILCSSFD